jgi:hypothetical protein
MNARTASIQAMSNHFSYFRSRVVGHSGKVTFMVISVGFAKIILVKKRSAIANAYSTTRHFKWMANVS